jgi:hypothetical protein
LNKKNQESILITDILFKLYDLEDLNGNIRFNIEIIEKKNNDYSVRLVSYGIPKDFLK